MDNEPNNSLDDAEHLTFLTMTGGGSINSIITGETLHTTEDPNDFFYFTHKAGLKQVTVSIDLTTVSDLLDQGGVYGETRSVTIAPVDGTIGQAVAIERVVGSDAYGDEWTALWQAAFAGLLAAIQSEEDGASADANYGQRVIDLANTIFESDGANVDPQALAQLMASEANANVFTSNGVAIREAAEGLAAVFQKWETPIYRDAVTKAVLGSGAKNVTWNTAGQSTAFRVSGGLTKLAYPGTVISEEFNVPSIQIFVKSEEGAKLPTGGNDKITGTTGPDLYDMLAGNDTVDGGKGNDTLWGNVGDDSILGGDGDDVLDGGPGKDTVDGGAGNDTIRGGSENDKLLGGSGTGKDNIDAFAGNDTVDAGAGNDTVLAGSGNDTVNAGDGDDFVNGEAGKDTIDGGAGNDTITGGAGKDSQTGGAGNDVFIYTDAAHSRGSTTDIITDFDRSGNDRINLEAVFGGTLKFRGEKAFSNVGQVRINDVSGADVVIQVNLDADKTTAELEIRLAGTSASIIKADDFFL